MDIKLQLLEALKDKTFVEEVKKLLSEDCSSPRQNSPRVREELESVLNSWNSKKLKSSCPNTSIRLGKSIFRMCRKQTPDMLKEFSRLRRSYDLADFEYAIMQYGKDRVKRVPDEQGFHEHCFSLMEFLTQRNGFIKFVAR